MYIFKNAFRNISRSKGRSILTCLIITCITIAACIAITINKSGSALVLNYKNKNPLKVTLNLDPMSFRNATDEEKEDFNLLDIDTINDIGEVEVVKDYYYKIEAYLNSKDVIKVSYDELFEKPSNEFEREDKMPNKKQDFLSSGDFNFLAFSDISYYEDFVNGTKKIKEGNMISNNSSDNEIVISEELAADNNIMLNDSINFIDVNDESITYNFKVIGIYETEESVDDNQMKGTIKANTIITNLFVINNIKENDKETSAYQNSNSISSVYYMESKDLMEFEEAIRFMGVSNYYQINTNEEEILASLKPIQNIASFSLTFLFVILVLGAVILTIINLFNIRERKYEIGVLRAIGMTKIKVTIQLVSEVLMIAVVSLIIGTVSGVLLTQKVANKVLKSEIENIKTEEKSIQENFGGSKEYNREAFNKHPNKLLQNDIDYVEELKVSIDFITILELFLVSILLTLISSSVAIMYVNKYEPNKILQNRN